MLKIAHSGSLVLLSTAALAVNPIGKWQGKIVMDPLPKGASAQEQRMAKAQVDMFKTLKIALIFKADKTYTVLTGEPSPNAKHNQSEGTWTQSGDKITIRQLKENGKPKTDTPQTLTFSKDGRTLTLIPVLNGKVRGPMGKFVFTRAG